MANSVEKPNSISVTRKKQVMAQLDKLQARASPPSKTRANRTNSVRGQQERQLDGQILRLHQAMVEKLLQNPDWIPQLQTRLEQQRTAGQLRHSAYLFWHCALAVYADPQQFRQAILSEDPSAFKYRRRTLLTGILTEEERALALQHLA